MARGFFWNMLWVLVLTGIWTSHLQAQTSAPPSTSLEGMLQEAAGLLEKTPWKSIGPANRAMKLAVERGDELAEARARMIMGSAHADMRNSEQALQFLLPALATFRQLKEPRYEADALRRIGQVYRVMQDYDKAMSHYEEAIPLYNQVADNRGLARTLNSMGVIYWFKKDYEKALDYYQQALEHQRKLNDPVGLAGSLNNVAMVYREMNRNADALAYYDEAIAISREVEYNRGLAITMGNKSQFLTDLGRYREATEYAQDSLNVAQAIDAPDASITALSTLSQISRKQGRLEEALKYRDQIDDLQKELVNTQLSERIAQIQAQHNIQQKEKAIELLEKENQIKELTISQQRDHRNVLFLGIALLIAVIGALLAVVVVRSRKNRVIQTQLEQLTEAMARIRKLKGLLPICAACKKVRDDQGYWVQVEEFVSKHSDATFSHGICPDCSRELYGSMGSPDTDKTAKKVTQKED